MQSVCCTSIRIPRSLYGAKHIVKPGFRPQRNKRFGQRVRLYAMGLPQKPAEIECDSKLLNSSFERCYPKTKPQRCRQRVSLGEIDVGDFRPRLERFARR